MWRVRRTDQKAKISRGSVTETSYLKSAVKIEESEKVIFSQFGITEANPSGILVYLILLHPISSHCLSTF